MTTTTVSFVRGQQYARRDVFCILGLPENTWGGNWFTGYNEYDGAVYVFTNVGAPGRTGHDYGNEWKGSKLVWFAKNGTRIDQPQIQKMLDPNTSVHIFWRADNDQSFVYAGVGRAATIKDTSPVGVLWFFDPMPAVGEYAGADEVRGMKYREGAIREVRVNAFERSLAARKACIAHWGSRCSVCGVSFEERYGELGKGFIHVHHLIPLAAVLGDYEVDPIHELRPVCPNCHAMLHRTDPPLSIEELLALIQL